jgi:hypothetical protein
MDFGIGHNSASQTIRVEVRLYNSLTDRVAGGWRHHFTLAAGATLGDIAHRLGLAESEIFLALVNGRDASPHRLGGVSKSAPLEDGDVVALSGPVPYSWGYGAPVI